MKLGACLWMEDDALPPDRERIGGAVLRIVGKSIKELTPVGEEEDGGDVFRRQYKEGVILCIGPVGNSAIYAVPGSRYDKKGESNE